MLYIFALIILLPFSMIWLSSYLVEEKKKALILDTQSQVSLLLQL
jgi:hypothetical protein